MLAHVPSFGRNPRGSPDFLAYPVPKACMHVLGTRVPRRLGVARSAPSPKAALALGCSLTPGLRISFGRVTCMARAASVPGLWALGFLLLACVCGWVRVAVGCGLCSLLPVVAGVLGGCSGPGSRLCPALLGWVVGVCFLRFFFFPLLAVLVPGLVVSPPIPFLSGSAAGFFFFFFFLVCVCLFRCPFSRWAAVPGLLLPVLAGWSPCASLGVLSPVPSGWGVCPLLCCGRAVWWPWAILPLPPSRPPLFFFFFFVVGGQPGCSSLCLPSAGARSVAGGWCGWSLATPGGGSCVLLPATPGWVSLPVLVGGPRHSWLGFAGGGGVWCVVCGGGVFVGLWLVCGVVGPSPLLAVVPVCYSPPLLAGFRCRCWWAVPATPGWGPLAALVCGVWCVAVVCWRGWGVCVVWLVPRHSWRRFLCATPRHSWLGFAAGGGGRSPPLLAGVRWRRWCVVCGVWRWCVAGVGACVWCGWSLATPGGGSCVLLPATPGWVSLPVVVGGPGHSWLGSAGGVGVLCAACGGGVLVGLWLVCGVVGPSPLLAKVPVCYSPPLLAGFRCRCWLAVPATPGWGPLAALVCGVWRWCVGGVVVGPSPLLAEVPVCYSPPLLAGFRCRCWWAVPATPGWGPLAAVVCGVWLPGRVGRAGLPGAFWCASPFPLAALSFCFAWPPSGLGLPPSLSLLLPLFWLPFFFFFSASRCLAVRALAPRLCLPLGRWLLFGGCSPAPLPFCASRFSSLLLGALVFFFFFFLFLLPLCAPVVSGFLWFPAPGALGLGACVFCFVGLPLLGSPCACPSFVLSAWLLAALWWLLPPPPPSFVSRGFRRCRSVLCAVLCCASLGAVLRRAAARFVARCCAAVCCVALVWCRCLLPCALRRCVLRCSPALSVFCRGAVVRAAVCSGVLCCAFLVLCDLCGPVLRCAGALALCCSCGACCCWRLVLWCAAVCCAVSCGVPWCGAGSGGPWLSAGGVFRCQCPCLAAWSASLWLVWFAVVPCFPVSCSVVLCCRVVLCCCALLSCCGAVGACFALLWAVVLCCVVLLVGCAVFCPVVVSACCGALFIVLCVPCLLRSVRCGALLCWLWCPASLCRVLWRCAVVWCCAAVLCCPFAVLFVFALPSCGLSCGARVVCAVVGASCCGVSLCVVVSPWAFCGVVVLLWCVVVSCCAVRCPVVSCALCRVLRCRAALRCCAGWLCCAVVCAAGVCFSFCPLFLC